MKHLFTKLLLILAVVFGVSVAQATDFYLVGDANAVGVNDAQGFTRPGVKLTPDESGSVYFWATGKFKISFKYDVDSQEWNTYNEGAICISDGNISYGKSDSNVGASSSNKLYVKLTYTGAEDDTDRKNPSKYSYEVQNTPFVTTPPTPVSYFENGSTIYFQPTSNFAKDASFKAKFDNNTEVFCSKLDDTGYWSFTVPAAGLTSVQIQRGKNTNTSVNVGEWWENYTKEMKYEKGMDLIYMDNAPSTTDEWRAASCIWKVYEAPAPAAYTYSAYNNFADGNSWEDLVFVEKNGVLTVEATFDGGLQVHRAFGIKVLDNGSQKGWYSAKIGEEILSLLNKETELSLYTTDIKNIQVPAGTTYCKIELTLDGTTPVSIKVTLEGERTPDLWLGYGSSSGSDRTKLGITAGEYDVYLWNTTTMGDSFRFYSAASGGKWIGPESNSDITIPGNGESQHKTAGNGSVYKFQTPGIYHIRVLSYDGDCGVVFKVMREEVVFDGDIPKYLSMQIWTNTQAELDPHGTVEMKYDEATKKFTGNVPAEWYGGGFWRTIRLTEKDENGKWVSSFGPSQELTDVDKKLYLSEPNRKHDLVRYSGNTVLGNFESNFHGYNNDTWCGDVTVVVDFSGSVPTVEVFPCYYFIGDQNKWFSKEFDGGDRGLDKTVRDANKAGWEFTPELDENGNPTGWYYRHTDRLAGQFQIFDGNNWDTGNTYSHVLKISKDVGIFEDNSYFERYM
ncbi:MAG: hypothetical protein K2I45_07345 [Muribaculaceae bacterium]|nr:hypothetical protein [Muribaculaceae bacterium]